MSYNVYCPSCRTTTQHTLMSRTNSRGIASYECNRCCQSHTADQIERAAAGIVRTSPYGLPVFKSQADKRNASPSEN